MAKKRKWIDEFLRQVDENEELEKIGKETREYLDEHRDVFVDWGKELLTEFLLLVKNGKADKAKELVISQMTPDQIIELMTKNANKLTKAARKRYKRIKLAEYLAVDVAIKRVLPVLIQILLAL